MKQDKELTQIEKFYAACKELGIDEDNDAVDKFLGRVAANRDNKSARDTARKAARNGAA